MGDLIDRIGGDPIWVFLILGLIQGGLMSLLLFYVVSCRRGRKELDGYTRMGAAFFHEDERYLAIKDEDLRYYHVNKGFSLFCGKPEEDVLGKSDADLFPTELFEMLYPLDREVLKTNAPVEADIDHENATYRIQKFPLILPHGRKGIGVNILDVTDKVRIRDEQQRAMRRNELLIDVFTRDFTTTQEQLDYVLSQALVMTESTYGYIYLYSEENKNFTLENFARGGRVTSSHCRKKQIYSLEKMGLWSESVRTRKPNIYNGLKKTWNAGIPAEKDTYFNMMTVPVIIEDKVVAIVGVANNPRGYQQHDSEELSLLMTGVWNAKERRESNLALKEAYMNIAENKDKLQLILNSSAEGIYGMDMDGNLTFINVSGLMLLGYEEVSEVLGRNCHELFHHSDKNHEPLPSHMCRIYRAIRNGESTREENEVFWRKDGSYFQVLYSAHPQVREGRIIGSVVTFMDITMRKQHEEKVLYLSYYDTLTGLHNRAYLEHVYDEIDQEENFPLSAVVGDVNGLKLSNDIFGHARGDAFLKRIAEIIKEKTRDEDLIFRVGGDEFYLFLKNITEEETENIMKRISDAIEGEDFRGVKGSISLGYAVKQNADQSLEDVLNEAEQNMYREKSTRHKAINTKQLNLLMDLLVKNEGEKAHAENTMNLSLEIGKELELSREDMRKLKEAAFLHDIGKVPNLLQQDDQGVSTSSRKDHSVIGYRILNSFEKTMDIARIVLSHHEKWNGKGYPKGLKGEEIPKLSRIIAVSEKYDRLTSKASGPGLTEEKALEELKKLAGVTLDRTVVEALFRIRKGLAGSECS